MTIKRFAPLAAVALFGAIALGGAAFAAETPQNDGQDAAMLANAKVSLGQAIAAAEQQSGGKAVGAGVENANGHVSISVDVADAQGKGVKTLLVDPQTGQVTAAPAGGDNEKGGDNGAESGGEQAD